MNLRLPALAAAAAAAAILTVGCTPAATDVAPPPPAATGQDQESYDPARTPAPNPSADDGLSNFDESYPYEDGVAVEVSGIEHGSDDGAAWVEFTLTVLNGSTKEITVSEDTKVSITYGSLGTEATPERRSNLPKKIPAAETGTATAAFLIPDKQQGNVTLDFSFDAEHESAVFIGSVR